MLRSIFTKAFRSGLVAATLAATLMATASPAHATGWFRKWETPGWWPFRPRAVATPEIDAGLARSAAAIVAGGLLVMRGRKKRPS